MLLGAPPNGGFAMKTPSLRTLLPVRWLQRFALGPTDLLRDATYRRLWTSILISSFGGQVTLLALPLSAAVLLHASPTQMGVLTAAETVSVCSVFFARRRVARSSAQIAGLRGRGAVDCADRGDGAARLVARLAVDAVALLRGFLDRRGRTPRQEAPRKSFSLRSCRANDWSRPTRRTRSQPLPPR